MKNSERRAWTEFVRQREQAPRGKKRERRSEQTPEPVAEDALDKPLREAGVAQPVTEAALTAKRCEGVKP